MYNILDKKEEVEVKKPAFFSISNVFKQLMENVFVWNYHPVKV